MSWFRKWKAVRALEKGKRESIPREPSGKARFAVMTAWLAIPVLLALFLWGNKVTFVIDYEGIHYRWDPTGWFLLVSISLAYAYQFCYHQWFVNVSDHWHDELDSKPCRHFEDELTIPPLVKQSKGKIKVVHGELRAKVPTGLSTPGTSGTIWDGIAIYPAGAKLHFGTQVFCNAKMSLRNIKRVPPHIRDALNAKYGRHFPDGTIHKLVPIRLGYQYKYPILTRGVMRQIVDMVRFVVEERRLRLLVGTEIDAQGEEHEIIEERELTDTEIEALLTPESIAELIGMELGEGQSQPAYDWSEMEKVLNDRIVDLENWASTLMGLLQEAGIKPPPEPQPYQSPPPGGPQGQPHWER